MNPVHIGWAADEFLLAQGFTIVDPGPGKPRTASRGDLEFGLEPRCGCDWCPVPDHPNYQHTSAVVGRAAA